MRSNLPVGALLLLCSAACAPALIHPSADQDRRDLSALEESSHQIWLASQLDELGALMDDDFRFVAMNGAVETKGHVIGTGSEPAAPRPLRIERLEVETQEVVLRGDVATVIALMHIDATVGGRPLPREMRVLSVFTRDRPEMVWRLTARSITPILAPGAVAPAGRDQTQEGP